MTPSMHLSAIMASYVDNPSKDQVKLDLQRAFDLGHEYGLSRAADEVDKCNREGPYNAIGAAKRIRALKVVSVAPVNTTGGDWDFEEGEF